jgi:hypothetical protein
MNEAWAQLESGLGDDVVADTTILTVAVDPVAECGTYPISLALETTLDRLLAESKKDSLTAKFVYRAL